MEEKELLNKVKCIADTLSGWTTSGCLQHKKISNDEAGDLEQILDWLSQMIDELEYNPMERAFDQIRAERERQNAKWGEQNHDGFIWLAILTEEVGELSEALLHDKFGGHAADNAEKELLHSAAVSVQWMEKLIRDADFRLEQN